MKTESDISVNVLRCSPLELNGTMIRDMAIYTVILTKTTQQNRMIECDISTTKPILDNPGQYLEHSAETVCKNTFH